MKTSLTLCAFATLIAALPSHAQSTWTGGYVGLVAGQSETSGGEDAAILFDTNLDGQFGDTVRTAAGVNAFSPGFCGGGARGRTPGEGCTDDERGDDYGLRAGYDWQRSAFVYGVVGEFVIGDAVDSVSAFSTTPASYTMTRKLDSLLALRGRLGFSFGSDRNLIYATAGYVQVDVENSFRTTNAVNTFTNNGNSEAKGPQYGAGYEHRFGAHFSLGIEYLFSDLEDDDFRVRSQGPAPATNPFILVNPNGTDFARSDEDLELESLRLTLSYRF